MDGRRSRKKGTWKGYRRRRTEIVLEWLILGAVIILVAVGVFWGVRKLMAGKTPFARFSEMNKEATIDPQRSAEESITQTLTDEELKGEERRTAYLAETDRMAAMYDYDKAIEAVRSYDGYSRYSSMTDAIKRYEAAKSQAVRYEKMDTITHVFFHSLVVDTTKAFDGDSKASGYNQVMTTVDEFNKMMDSMYAKGYVIVDIHDIAKMVPQEDGTEKMEFNDIYLPEGKIPFVISQDDTSYYEYMAGDGFADRIIVDENGDLKCEMTQEDKSVAVGDFDMVPLIETFVKEHPDFSYRGAKGLICLTGYNGILGYRTDTMYADNPTYEQDLETAKYVASVMKEKGWSFASHTWGHTHMGQCDMERFKTDTEKWRTRVEPLLGEVDVMVYPFGEDIGDWHAYSGERFELLKEAGFDYFCNVDSSVHWIQMGTDYFRQGRRNLDGMRMWQDIQNPEKNRTSDLFDVNEVFDPARPTPVQ